MADLYTPLSSGPLAPQTQSGGILGGILSKDPLPQDFQSIRAEVPDLTKTADVLKGYGWKPIRGLPAWGLARFQYRLGIQEIQLTFSFEKRPDEKGERG